MTPVEPLDLHHQGTERIVGAYLLETADGPALFDCGPTTCAGTLEQRLGGRGLALTDIRHLLLSHIHLDHAGAAGVLVRRHPGLKVHVSAVGAPHLVDPARLERSARRLYGDEFNTLWGELAPVPKQNVNVVNDLVAGLECFASPGHASHHVCYLAADGTLYAGDAAGVRVRPGRFVFPPTPPPELDLEAWERTFDEILARSPERLALIHFGVFEDVPEHIAQVRARLGSFAERVRTGMDERAFAAAARSDLAAAGEPEAERYERAAPFWQSYAGLRRYWDKRLEQARNRTSGPCARG